MRRIVILGCPGSGKSTLATRLGERLGLPVIHLDTLYWLPGWQAPDSASYHARFAEAFAAEAWISEGNFIETFATRLPRADLVIILDRPRWACLWRVLRRAFLERHARADLPAGCGETLDWQLLRNVWRYDREMKPRVEAARLALGGHIPMVRLRSDSEAAVYLRRLTPALP
ncbi:MAG TPA: hypothetical protein VG308_20905 [Stellaceae bacterium]|jgi:adenylate kinase family enzyme|nr:hypothetical protein [Stellaceae bacterium]